jgi:hypothetical protein
MKNRSKTEITVETRRILAIKRRSRPALEWCPECGGQSEMVTPDEAAILRRVSSRAIYVAIEAEELHFIETQSGLILICLRSLID